MGVVYLALDPALNRHVAIKHLIEPDGRRSIPKTLVRRFFREAQATARLNHPHIVTLY